MQGGDQLGGVPGAELADREVSLADADGSRVREGRRWRGSRGRRRGGSAQVRLGQGQKSSSGSKSRGGAGWLLCWKLNVTAAVATNQLYTHVLGRLAWFGSGWVAHTSADMRKVEKGINIPNFPGIEEKGKSKHSDFPRG